MENKLNTLLKTYKSLVFTIVFILFLNTYPALASDYFISATGNDNNAGTITAPFFTLNKAWSVVKAGDFIYLRGGVYTYTSKQSLTGKNGTASNLIKVSAYADETPIITFGAATPGITITGNYISFKGIQITGLTTLSSWTNQGNGIYSKTVSCESATNMVTINGVNTPMGRYPKTGWLTIDSHIGTTSLTDAAMPIASNLAGGEIVVRRYNWVTDRCKISNQSGSTLTYAPYTGGTTSEPKDGARYFIQNHMSTLTQLGDWYYNGTTFYMYFGTNNPTSYTIKISTVNVPMDVFNCNYLTFDNMTFEGGNLASFNSTLSDYVTVQNCTIKNSGKNGIMTGVWGGTSDYLKVTGCLIDNTNNCAISLERENAYATVSNNTISNTGVLPGMGSKDAMPGVFCAINSYLSNYCTVEYNKITNTGYVPISVGDKGTIIRNNFIDTYCTSKDDGGGIYMYGGDATIKREIKNNIILNGIGNGLGSANGIYMDDKTNNVEVSGNTIATCNHSGIYIHNSQSVYVHDNTIYDAAIFLLNLVHDNNSSTSPLRNTIVTNNILFSKTISQTTLQYATLANPSDISLFGSINNNFYCSPLNNDPKFQTFYGGWANASLKNFVSWKTYCGQDANSSLSPVTVPDISYFRLEYNASTVNKTIVLDGTYVDAKNSKFSGSITLLPYTSAVLMRVSSAVVQPVNQAPSIQNQGFEINNSSSNGTVVGTVVGTDPDAGQVLSYTILSGNTNNAFAINASTGVITVANSAALLSSNIGENTYSLFQLSTPSSSIINNIGTGTAPLEVGMKFSSNIGGYITGFRFYKGVGGQGTHIGNLWSINGTKLASATFTNETASGWQTVTLSTPVAITANTTYVVSYFSQHGDFVKTDPFFTSNIVNGPLTGLGWTATEPNGVYKYSSSSSFPNVSTYAGKSNYWADVIFSSSSTTNTASSPIILVVKVQDNGTGSLSSQANISITINSNAVNQSPVIKDQTFTLSGNNLSNGTVVGNVIATDPDAVQTLTYSILSGNTGNAFAINSSTGVITIANSSSIWGTSYSLFQSITPSSSAINNLGTGTSPLEVGMKFNSNVGGYITGLRFYKGVGGKGTHIGNLWSSNGTNLASAVFTNETASGWQTVTLSSPVAITANTTYIVSYFSQNGDFVKTDPYFTSNIVNGPLTGLGWTSTEPNGIYKYSSSSSFPNVSTYAGKSNYWSDIIFVTTLPPVTSTLVVKVQDNGSGNLTAQATVTINMATLKSANLLSFISVPQDTITVGSLYSYKVVGFSGDGSEIAYSSENLPYWLNFTDNGDGTGLIEGIPNNEDIGFSNIIIKERNSNLEILQEFSVEVKKSSLLNNKNALGIQVYPNPVTNGILNVKLDKGINEKCELLIFDMHGKALIHTEYDPSILLSLDLSKYPSGTYVIQIRSSHFNFSNKFVLK